MPSYLDTIFGPAYQAQTPFSKPFQNIFGQPNVDPFSASPTDGSTVDSTAPQPSSIADYYTRALALMPTSGQQSLSDLASLFGSFSSGQKANRISSGQLQNDYNQMMLNNQNAQNALGLNAQSSYDQLMLNAAANQRTSEADAMKKLQQAEYLKSGGSQYVPPTYALSGKTVTAPSLPGIAPVAPTEAEKAGATTLSQSMLDRLKAPAFQPTQYSPSYTFSPTMPSTSPGVAEQIGNYGALGLGALGALDKLSGGATGNVLKSVLGKIGLGGGSSAAASGLFNLADAPGLAAAGGDIVDGVNIGDIGGSAAGGLMSGLLGKALPIAGIGLGAYGLIKHNGNVSNVLNGASTGAGIGSLIMPGVGTAIGAGLGALGGGVKDLFNIGKPSKTELDGRAASAQGIQMLTQSATPQQRQEAAASGWADPTKALENIVIRDALIKKGLPPDQAGAQASQLFNTIFTAEKQGPDAVQAALQKVFQVVS